MHRRPHWSRHCAGKRRRREAGFSQGRPGLHHLCFRAKSAADVDAIHEVACALGAKIIRAPREDSWAPGYYSVLFEDLDGIRIEANFVPGKGHLADAGNA